MSYLVMSDMHIVNAAQMAEFVHILLCRHALAQRLMAQIRQTGGQPQRSSEQQHVGTLHKRAAACRLHCIHRRLCFAPARALCAMI